MEKIRKVVVPVDFSDNTEKLADYARYMGKELSAALHFIHVVGIYSGDAMVGMPFSTSLKKDYEATARERMNNLVDDMIANDTKCKGEVLTGEPVEEIVNYAEKEAADLIIISTHGVKGWEKILLGSVAERVVHKAHCPVLFMNPFKMDRK